MCALGHTPPYDLGIMKELADDRWREFDHKTRWEWRLSFALWLALLAAIAGLGRGEFGTIAGSVCLMIALPLAIIVWAVHFVFLLWIQAKLQAIRADMWEIYKVRWNTAFAGTLRKDGNLRRDPKRQVTMLVQLTITALLGVLLVSVAWSCRYPAPRSAPQAVSTVASQQAATPGAIVKTKEAETKP